MLVEEMVVDEQARTRFREDGYWLGPEVFDAAQREELAYAVDEVNAGRYENRPRTAGPLLEPRRRSLRPAQGR